MSHTTQIINKVQKEAFHAEQARIEAEKAFEKELKTAKSFILPRLIRAQNIMLRLRAKRFHHVSFSKMEELSWTRVLTSNSELKYEDNSWWIGRYDYLNTFSGWYKIPSIFIKGEDSKTAAHIRQLGYDAENSSKLEQREENIKQIRRLKRQSKKIQEELKKLETGQIPLDKHYEKIVQYRTNKAMKKVRNKEKELS